MLAFPTQSPAAQLVFHAFPRQRWSLFPVSDADPVPGLVCDPPLSCYLTCYKGLRHRVHGRALHLEQHSSQAPGLVLQPCSCMIQYKSWGMLNSFFHRWLEKRSERFAPSVHQDFSTQHPIFPCVSWALPFPTMFNREGSKRGDQLL